MSDDFWRWAGKTIGKTQQTMDEARKEAERLAREAQKQLDEAGKVAKSAAGQVTQSVADTVAGVAGQDSMAAQAAAQVHQSVAGQSDVEPIDLTALPEHQRVAFAGALFAMADADGAIDKEELQLIFELTDLDGISLAGKQAVLGYIIKPPAFVDALAPFAHAGLALRCALILNLLEVAIANDLVGENQKRLIGVARRALNIDDARYEAIERFQKQMRQVRLRGLNDSAAAEAAKSAVAGLAAVGVPIAAVYVSGSVIGLSAAGITSGLAAVGLGLGMVPGIGVAVLLGAGIFMGVRYLLDAGQEREKERLRAEAMRKAQLVILNLQEAISMLAERMQELQGAVADAEASRAAALQLNERLRALQQIVARRKEMAEALQ
jgi:hypothetical protein